MHDIFQIFNLFYQATITQYNNLKNLTKVGLFAKALLHGVIFIY